MNKLSNAEKWFDYTIYTQKDLDQYYCADIFIKELELIYQFKIWETHSDSLSILIKENSEFLNWINPGDRFMIRYYSHDPDHKYHDRETEFTKLERQTSHRLKGHYLAGLEMTGHQTKEVILLPCFPHSHTFLTPLPNYNM
jgi:hypothetical protein